MNEAQVCTVEQMRQILGGAMAAQFFAVEDDDGRYRWLDKVQRRLGYRQLRRLERGGAGVPAAAQLHRCRDWCRDG